MNGHAHKAEANRLTEEMWGLVRRSASITGGEMAAAIVRMLRERGDAWEASRLPNGITSQHVASRYGPVAEATSGRPPV